MAGRTWRLPEAVQRKLAALGSDGSRWVASLEDLVRDLEVAWGIRVGATLHGGSEALGRYRPLMRRGAHEGNLHLHWRTGVRGHLLSELTVATVQVEAQLRRRSGHEGFGVCA